MSRLKICFYSVATHLGGAERSLLDLVRALSRDPAHRYEPWVLLSKSDGPLLKILADEHIEYDVLPMPEMFFKMSRSAPVSALLRGSICGPGVSAYLWRLRSLLKLKQPGLIHTTGIKCHAVGAVVGQLVSVPVLWHLRDLLDNGPTLWLLRALRQACGVHVIANSKATANAFLSSDNLISIIHNGLDPAVFKHKPNRDFHQVLGIDPSIPMVGIVGVIAQWKGQLEFIRMAKHLIEQGSNAYFVIIGDQIYDTEGEGGFLEKLRYEAVELGISKRILFTGFKEDPVRAINGLDVLVHASVKPEPFGRVILEAMACGVPVAASADGGVLELIRHDEGGLLYKPGSVEDMARAVGRLVGDLELRKRLSDNAYKVFTGQFTCERHAEAVMRVYESVLTYCK